MPSARRARPAPKDVSAGGVVYRRKSAGPEFVSIRGGPLVQPRGGRRTLTSKNSLKTLPAAIGALAGQPSFP